MILALSFIILFGYIAFYIIKVGLPSSHSESYYKLGKLGFLFQLTLGLSAFLLMIVALELTPEPLKFTAFLTTAPILFTALAPKFKDKGLESDVHFASAKLGGAMSFLWALWMSYSINLWLLVTIIGSALLFYILNKIYNKPLLFLEYAIFLFPYIILAIVYKITI